MPLYELLEELFSIFEMKNIKAQDAYLFAFFDAVTDYLQNTLPSLTHSSVIGMKHYAAKRFQAER